jgi:hypothetical protein
MTKPRGKSSAKAAAASVTRRRFLQRAMAGSAAAGLTLRGAAGMGPAARAAPSDATAAASAADVLDADQREWLTAVLDRLIPASGQMPAAGAAGVTQFIDELLVDARHLRRPILDVLGAVRAASGVDHPSSAPLDRILADVERQDQRSFDVLLQAAYTGYYGHPRVLRALHVVQPGREETEAFDPALLEAVRQRGSCYRDV